MGIIDHLLIEFELHYTKWNSYLTPLPGWEPLAIQNIDPREKPNTIMELNGYGVKPVPNDFIFIYKVKCISLPSSI